MKDLIKREDAIDAVSLEFSRVLDLTTYDAREIAEYALYGLPLADITETEQCQKCQERHERILRNDVDVEFVSRKRYDELEKKYNKLIVQSVEAVQELIKWIPCSKMIPREEVLARNIDGDIMIGYISYEFNQFFCENDVNVMSDAIEWTPLPTPYKSYGE